MSRLTVHYHRYKQDYDNWDLWIWSAPSGMLPDSACAFSAYDEYGVLTDLPIPAQVAQIGFILRFGSDKWLEKDTDKDRFVTIVEDHTEIWLVEGNPYIFHSSADARATAFPQVGRAYLDGSRLIDVRFAKPPQLSPLLAHIYVKDLTEGTEIPVAITPVQNSAQDAPLKWQLFLSKSLDVTHLYTVSGTLATDVEIIPRRVLDEADYVYPGDDLGCICDENSARFRLWAPTASNVDVLIFDTEAGPIREILMMRRTQQGTWFGEVEGAWHGKYYQYQLEFHGKKVLAVDPYTKALSTDRSRGLIVDLSQTNPAHWEQDHTVYLANPTDAIIYELHLRDFSVHHSAGAIAPGKYLQFIERGLITTDGLKTGIDHLLELGVTHVQILPVNEFGRFGEKNQNEYNWGYDPRFYLVPEGRYATSQTGITRIKEFKQMILALHEQGLGIILDVVFNHVFYALHSSFQQIVPEYFFRTDDAGHFTDGARVGNELAIERPMVGKFVKDALTYWVREYHVDGFRLDLMALFGHSALLNISQSLHTLRPDLLIYGEPWAAGPSGIYGDHLFLKGDQKGTDIAVFNDQLRDALMGPVFDRKKSGYVGGNTEYINDVKKGIAGSIDFQADLIGFTKAPVETVNYVSCHDNLTLWDRININEPWEPEHLKVDMDLFAQTVILLAQGIPFMQSGEEFLRTKRGEDNTYLAGDEINALDWHRKMEYYQVFSFYKGLIQLRKQHPAFRMTTAEQVRRHLEFIKTPLPLIAWHLKDHANHDPWEHIIVVCNPLRTLAGMTLPPGVWAIVVDKGRAGIEPIGFVEHSVQIYPISCLVLYQLS